MTADKALRLDQSDARNARPATAQTLDDLIGQIRDIMRADDPLAGDLSIPAADGR